MIDHYRHGVRALLAAGALASLAACGDQRAGMPVSVTSSEISPSSSSVSAPTKTAGSSELGSLDPCGLLTDGERVQLQLPIGEPDTTAGNPGCDWNKGADGGIVSVTIRDGRGIDDLNPGNASRIEDIAIGTHQGRRLEFPEGNCNFDIAITAESSVTVSALIVEKVAEACALAQQAVNLIEPKLPKG